MKTAKELRKLHLVQNDRSYPVTSTVKQLVERSIELSSKHGLTQTHVELNMKDYSHGDLMDTKRDLVKRGFVVVTGQVSGILDSNLIVPAKYTLKVMW